MTSVPPPTTPEPELAAPPRQPEPGAPLADHLAVWMAPAAIVAGLGLGVVLEVAVSVIISASGRSLNDPGPALNLLLNANFDLSFVAAALYFVRAGGGARPADFGYVRPRLGYAAAAVFAGAAAYYLVTFIYQAIFTLHGQDKLPHAFGDVRASTGAMVCAAAFVCVIAPITEEFFFRGFLFGVLRDWRGPWLAAVLTSLLFGAVHVGSAPIEDLIPLAFFGFVLCMIRWRTGSLYPSMALHSINNSLALGITDLKWGGGSIVILIVCSLSLILTLTLPLSARAEPEPAYR
jgi:membrane protease YdiL (CAAX protease family)